MNDIRSPESFHDGPPPVNIRPEPTAKGVSSIQGTSAPLEGSQGFNWTHEDGTAYHAICEQEVQDQVEDVDKGVEVNNNLPVTLLDGDGNQRTGFIDTHVEDNGHHSIIDYKTNDMSNWSVNDAIRFGHEHGSQMEGYLNSPDVPSNSKGYILSLGKASSSPEVMDAYARSISEHGVQTVFVGGDGSPKEVVNAVRVCMRKTRNLK